MLLSSAGVLKALLQEFRKN
uniref:Uncharacterized protein n=1 Tax=Rhizophora mucronata TaxID=61149 RepID=A0A2P2MY55_RHIMU